MTAIKGVRVAAKKQQCAFDHGCAQDHEVRRIAAACGSDARVCMERKKRAPPIAASDAV
jgi:hypothetical protein